MEQVVSMHTKLNNFADSTGGIGSQRWHQTKYYWFKQVLNIAHQIKCSRLYGFVKKTTSYSGYTY